MTGLTHHPQDATAAPPAIPVPAKSAEVLQQGGPPARAESGPHFVGSPDSVRRILEHANATDSRPFRTGAGNRTPATTDVALFLRTVFATVLSLNFNSVESLSVAFAASGQGSLQLARIRIAPRATLGHLLRSWEGRDIAETAGGALDELRQLIETSTTPGFVLAAPEAAIGSELPVDLPLRCVARMTDDGVMWWLDARRDIADEALLETLASQASRLIHAACEDPDATLGDLVSGFRQATFEIQVVAPARFAEFENSLRVWGGEIGLPLTVWRVEREDIQGRGPATSLLQPWGANLVVVARDPTGLGRMVAAWGTDDGVGLTGQLPDGTPIADLHSNETRELFDEIVVRSRYLRGGIEIRDGDLVVDVGANIGLFTLYAAAQAADVRIHAFEPVPAAAEALETNVRAYGIRAEVERAALGCTAGEGSFTYYPQSSLQSGLYPDPVVDEAIARGYARHRADGLPPTSLPSLDVADALAPELHGRLSDRQRLTVPVLRLSDWIRGRAIDRIHLLKVDAERAEGDVLAGIDLEHWPLIDQVVVEVHDITGRLGRLRALLSGHGFDTLVEQDELFVGSEIVMLYAWRPQRGFQGSAPWVVRQVEAAERWAELSPLPVVVTVAPGMPETHVEQVRREAEARGLTWAAPPADGSALVWAEAVLRRMTARDRPVAKAVVVDADNTLWGGVCGEVGPEDVDVTGPFRLVQEFVSEQARAGRMLALCSRNNRADVEAVFAAHPDMPLTLDDFACVHASWGTKSDAVATIADELGFAVESLVFIDDSPAERAEVSHHHPGLTVVELPDDPQRFVEALQATWQLALDAPTTAEDGTRVRGFAQDAERKAVAARSTSRSGYLRALGLAIDVADAAAGDTDRIAQLAARTTQFNVCLRRHTPASVRQLITGPEVTVTVRVRDRFGDYGLVGFASAAAVDGVLLVGDFFISCRAMGRNVEWYLLRALGQRAVAAGLAGVRLEAVTGGRNVPARAFVHAARAGFAGDAPSEDVLLDSSGLAKLDWQLIDTPQAPTQIRADGPAPVQSRASQVRWPVSAAPARQAAATANLPSTQRELSTVYIAPETATERHIAAVWEDVLGVRPIGVVDDLFALGCDSLTAAVICARLRQEGLDVALADLLRQPTVREASRLAHPVSPTGSAAEDLHRATDDGTPAPASPGQLRIWTAEAIGHGGNAQVIPSAHRITGPLDTARLREAFTIVVQRHEALRTALTEHDGLLRQRLLQPAGFDLAVVDLARLSQGRREEEAGRMARQFFAAPFDLEQDTLIRATVVRLDAEDHLLLVMVHHSACDGWSMDLIHRDLSAAYADPPALACLASAPFADYSRTVADRHRRGEFDRRIAHVLATVGAVPAQPWSTASGQNVHLRHLRFALGLDVVRQVRATAQARSTSPFHLYLAAYQLLLAAAAGSVTVVSGVPVANRTDPAYAETVGFFANLVPVPLQVDWSATIGSHLAAALAASGEALNHAEVPYGLLAQGQPSVGGLFDNLFTLQPPPEHTLDLPGCASAWADPDLWPLPFPLMLDLQEHPGGASGLLRSDAHAVMPASAEWITEAYPLVVTAVCTLPGLHLEHLRAVLRPPAPDAQQLVQARLRALTGREAASDV
ncbi:FkbM family methyltransferase [Streptomyces sp. NPDC096311]|uniref:FkbM family methyltransferase n=1 Tax=Streptomyces sp. NPDC096311 TaxID=3366083 RepID=UPI00381E9C11